MIDNKEISKEILAILKAKKNKRQYEKITASDIERLLNFFSGNILRLILKGGFITLQAKKNDNKHSIIRIKPKKIDVVNYHNRRTSIYHAWLKRTKEQSPQG